MIVEKFIYFSTYLNDMSSILGYFGLSNSPSDIPVVEYNTGDLILFSGSSILDLAVRYCSKSSYSHCGIILNSPVYIDPKLVGIYFIESTLSEIPDVEDGKIKFGVTLHLLSDILSEHAAAGDKAFLRKVSGIDVKSDSIIEKIKTVYNSTQNIPYDIDVTEWLIAKDAVDAPDIDSFLNHHFLPKDETQRTASMWCSEFAGFFYTSVGVLDPNTPWGLLAPKHFSQATEDLDFINGCSLGDEISIS